MKSILRHHHDRGSVAVEFALIVPVFVLLVFGAIEFSSMYNQQVTLSNAARTAARTMAIGNVSATAISAAVASAPGLSPALTASNFVFSPTACSAGATITATITYQAHFMTGMFGDTLTLKGKAAMPCGG